MLGSAPRGSFMTTGINLWGSDTSPRSFIMPLIALQIAGGLAVGAAAVGGYAYHQHQKHKDGEEEVSSLIHCPDFLLLTIVKETSPLSGTTTGTTTRTAT
jgi:hypothetical protein